MRGALFLPTLLLLAAWPGQEQSVLHIRVTLVDAEHGLTPVPRHALLVSDNPSTTTPRRIVTAADGTVDVSLRPGSYTVESDQPVVLNGKAYQWTATLQIAAGRDATLELSADNAEIGPVTPAIATLASPENDPSSLLGQWKDSVVALWSPTSHASGFLVDAKGLVATNQRAVGTTTTMEVQLTPALKVSGLVLAADAARDVAVLWIDPKVAESVRPLALSCAPAAKPAVMDRQKIFTIGTSLRGQKALTPGTASVESQAVVSDLSLESGSAGGPIFTADGPVIGITAGTDETDQGRQRDVRVVPLADACEVLALAEKKLSAAAPPSGAHLPVEPERPFPPAALEDAARRRGGSVSPYQMSSGDFDIAFITPVLAYAAEHRWEQSGGRDRTSQIASPDAARDPIRLLTDFSNWSEYVADFPPVLLVRVTPRLVEGFWTMVGRGAAQTQGVSLPAVKHFRSGFSRMRVFCGVTEVAPVHPFILVQRISENDPIHEGLYVFDPATLTPQCGSVRITVYSEKDPAKGDARIVDPRIVQQIWQDFTPYRVQK
jgi:hypothetical protein